MPRSLALAFASLCVFILPAAESWPALVSTGDGFDIVPGFKAEVIASDPLINNPAAMCVAPDGRIFVCEEFVHAHVPGKKRDTVQVLTDIDAAGHPTKALTLADDLGSVQGLAFADGKLFISHTPRISMLPVSADNKPGKLEDIVVGIGIPSAYKATHCATNLLVHDGKLYIVHGDQGCDVKTKEGTRVYLACGGILRCNLDGSNLEVYASGFRNIYGADFDENDNLFVRDNTNDGGGYNVRSYHVVKGAYFGWPFRWRESDTKTPPVDVLSFSHDQGGGSPCGCVYLNFPNWPEQYSKGFLFCEWGNRQMIFSKPAPTGATFDIVEHPFLTAKGAKREYTFRPTGAAVEPGGSLLIADWGSSGLYPEKPKGRLVRISYTGPKPAAAPPSDLAKMSSATPANSLIESLSSADPRIRAKAALLLGELKHASAADKLAQLVSDSDPSVRLRAATALGDLKDSRQQPILLKALATEKERWVRHLLVRGIREIGDFSSLFNSIEDAPPAAQIDALYAVREIYDSAIAGSLIQLSQRAKRAELRAKATEFLGLIAKKEPARWTWGDKPHIDEPLRNVEWDASAQIMKQLYAAIHDTEPLVKNAALNALFKLKDTSVVTSILDDIEHGKAALDDDASLILVLEGFGKPHIHSGLGIRKLGRHLYECRTSRSWRLIFEARKGTLTFDFAGDHDEILNYLRGK